MEVIGWNLLDLIRWALAKSSELSQHGFVVSLFQKFHYMEIMWAELYVTSFLKESLSSEFL